MWRKLSKHVRRLLLHDMYPPLLEPFLHRPLWSMGDMPNLELHPWVRELNQHLQHHQSNGQQRENRTRLQLEIVQ
jgi:hypothetical protein